MNFQQVLVKDMNELLMEIYIWQHLDKEETYSDCTTTSHLIDIWFKQICKKSNSIGVDERVVRDTLKYTVEVLDKIGRLYVPKRILNIDERGLDYLIYAELLVKNGQKLDLYINQF